MTLGGLYHAGTRLPGAVANCYEEDRLCVLPVSALWNALARSANTSAFAASAGNPNPESERNSLDLRSRVSGSLIVSLLGCLPSPGRVIERSRRLLRPSLTQLDPLNRRSRPCGERGEG